MMTSYWQMVTPLSFFSFMVDQQPSGNRIPAAWSIKLRFSLTITFHLTKPENRTQKSPTQVSYQVSSITGEGGSRGNFTPSPPPHLPEKRKKVRKKTNSLKPHPEEKSFCSKVLLKIQEVLDSCNFCNEKALYRSLLKDLSRILLLD